jgi:GNAT superfamily N-acetyltransferase
MSLYSEYIHERGDAKIIELPQGFATYNLLTESQVWLMDVYVKPDFRRTHIASELANMVAAEGRKAGCKEMIATIVPSLNGSTISVKTVIGYGFKLKLSKENLVIFSKELV